MHGVRAAIPQTDPLAKAEFATIRERLIKIGARDRAPRAHPHPAADELPGGRAVPHRRARHHAVRAVSGGALCPDVPPTMADQPRTRCTVSGTAADQPVAAVPRASPDEVQKRAAWCIIRVSDSQSKS